MSKELGALLRTLRKNSELTQKDIADALKIDRSTYAYYERGTTEPDFRSLVKIAAILNVPPAALLPGNTDVGVSVNSQYTVSNSKKRTNPKNPKIYTLTNDERQLIVTYRLMSPDLKQKLIEYASELNETLRADRV